MPRIWILLFCLLFARSGHTHTNCDEIECDEVKEEIREIEAKMRAGYTRSQGEKYEAKLRKLKSKRYKICR